MKKKERLELFHIIEPALPFPSWSPPPHMIRDLRSAYETQSEYIYNIALHT